MLERSIAVIDGNSLLHRAFHAVRTPMNAPDGTPTNAVFGFMQMLIKMVEDMHPSAIVCAWDVHRPDWRMKLLERYKAQRPPMDPDLAVQFEPIRNLLEAMNIPCISIEGFEGDDILGTLSVLGEAAGMRVYLVTGDKDAYQLVTDKTSVVTTKKGMSQVVVMTPRAVEERYGVTPGQVPDFLGLKGDPSDNIPGVPSIGEKTAAKLLAEYGTLEEVLAHADEIKGKIGQNLREHAQDALVSREVATIRTDAPVELDVSSLRFPDFDAKVVADAFGALHFNKHLREVLGFAGADAVATAAPQPAVKLSYHVSKDAGAYVSSAIRGGRWLAVAVDEPAELSLFDDAFTVVFSDGAGLACAPLADAAPLILDILRRGKLAGLDVKALLRRVFPAGAGHDLYAELDPARLFDCGLAAYLLDSGKSYAADGLAMKYLALEHPQGDKAPSAGQFEAAVAAALVDVLEPRLRAGEAWGLFTEVEMPLLPVLVQMESIGVQVDTEVLKGISADIAGDIERLKSEMVDLAGEDFNVDSPSQLSHILFYVLGLDKRMSKKTKRQHVEGEAVYSTNAQILEKLSESHPLPGKVVEYRELAKLRSTYLEALPQLIDSADGRIHTHFNQAVTATGRLSSSDPNLQNIPVRSELGRRIREAFVAPEGGVFLSADYSQIELRLLAHLSKDEGLIAAFESGEDFHAHTAAGVFGVAVEDVTPQMRARAKAVNFGIVYGQQAFGLGQSLHIPKVEAQGMIDRYYAAYPGVREYLDRTVAQARERGYAETMFGRRRYIPELASRNRNLQHFGERTAMNHPMQGSAADIIKLAMIKVAARMRDEGFAARMVLQVHDELDFECPDGEVETLSELVREVMDNVVELAVPLVADVQVGPNWAIAH